MVHLYKNNEKNIVLDVNSGCVHVVDDIVYNVIERMKSIVEENSDLYFLKKEAIKICEGLCENEELEEIVNEILELYQNGQLFSKDIYKEYITDFKKRETVVKALCLHIAHDCNLACQYCFAEEGEYHGRRELMIWFF